MKKRGMWGFLFLFGFFLVGVLVSLIFSLSFSGFVSGAVFNSELDNGLLAYWSFDDGTAKDSLGVYNGTINGANCSVAGKRGKACSFDGTDDYINTGYNFNLNYVQSFSIGLWYKPYLIPNTYPKTVLAILGKGCDPNYAGTSYEYSFLQENEKLWFINWNGEGASDCSACHSGQNKGCCSPINIESDLDVLATDDFSFVLVTYNNTNYKAKIYIDGSEQATTDVFLQPFVSTNYPFLIGRTYNNAGCAYARGSIDEVGIWNRVLNGTEVPEIYDAVINPPIPPNITSANFTKNGNIISSYVLGSGKINLSVSGTSMTDSGIYVNYTMYNSSNKAVLSVQQTSKNESWDYYEFNPISLNLNPGTYYFNASLKDSSSVISSRVSGNLIVSNYPLLYRNVTCNLSIPANAVANSVNDINFTQTSMDNGFNWNPPEKNWSYNTNAGECKFKCASGYEWNESSCNYVISNQYCYQLEEADCKVAGNEFAIREFDYFSTFDADLCSGYTDCANDNFNYSVKCLCYWNSTGCSAVTNFTLLNHCGESTCGAVAGEEKTCSFTSSIINNNCNNSINTMEVAVSASWNGISNCKPKECADKTAVYQCVATAKLGFFDSKSFIITLILIAAIYSIIELKKRK